MPPNTTLAITNFFRFDVEEGAEAGEVVVEEEEDDPPPLDAVTR